VPGRALGSDVNPSRAPGVCSFEEGGMVRKASTAIAILCLTGALTLAQDGKVRVFVTDSESWTVSGGFAAASGAGAGGVSGGARPQTAEIMKTFRERCPRLTVTIRQDNADYVVLLDHEGGKDFVRRDNKIAIFNKAGDMIYSGSTRSLGNAVKDACGAVDRDLSRQP
jgi:hypothetical protein